MRPPHYASVLRWAPRSRTGNPGASIRSSRCCSASSKLMRIMGKSMPRCRLTSSLRQAEPRRFVANYPNIMRMRPEVRQFIRNRRWVHRGDVIFYGPNIRCDAFSTDAGGIPHSSFKGETFRGNDCLQRDRYGLVLGPSSVYGFGLGGNENTMPSLLAERFGFPFANVGLPAGNSRNLFSLLMGFVTRATRLPSVVLHLSGGDFTSFCYTGIADPVFGSPNLKQASMAV